MRNPGSHRTRLIAILLLTATVGVAQDEIGRRKAELDTIREEISRFEEKIAEQEKTEKTTLDLIDSYDKKTSLVRSLIRQIKASEKKLQGRIDSMKAAIGDLENQMKSLREHYAQYVTSVYKAGPVRDFELLMTSRSFNQAIVRSEYLNRFADQRRRDAERIKAKGEEIESLQLKLQENLTEQRRLLAEKGSEEDRLELAVANKQNYLKQVRKDRRTLQAEIERKMKAAKELEGVIAALIEAERLREAKKDDTVPPPPPVTGIGFGGRKGTLRWPVTSRTVVAKFGNQKHPTLKTVTENPGIDISVSQGSPVVAVAGGRVARIWWLVSYGNLIILDHGDGYRTIYAHLSDITVTEGQTVTEGDVIATSGETVDGSRLHFEIWKDRDKQNPEQWLARR